MTGMNENTGKRMQRTDHIRQSVRSILSTPIGSVLMREEFGSYLFELVDEPLVGATLLRAYAASVGALIRWEPRIAIQTISFSSTEEGNLVVDIDTSETSNTSDRMSVPLELKGVTAP